MGNLLRGVVVLSLSSTAAWAQSAEVEMDMGDHAPRLDATVIGAPMASLDKIELSDESHHTVGATSVRAYADGDEPMSIMFVTCGQEIWTGNDTIETDEIARYSGTLIPFEQGIEHLGLVHRFPGGSQAGIVTYATGARIRMPLSPIAHLHGSSFGTQRDYYNQLGNDMVSGVTLGLSQLEHATTPRKVLIVFGDGSDTNNETAAVELADLKKRAAMERIDVYSIVYKSAVSDEANVVMHLTAKTRMISSTAGIATELDSVVQHATDRFYVTFDIRSLPVFDGHSHELTLRLGHDDQEPVSMWFAAPPVHHSWLATWWRGAWLQLVGGLAGIGLLALLSRRYAR